MRNLFWGITFVLIGLLLLLDNLGYADFEQILHDYWPLLLIVWGGLILFRKKTPKVAPFPPPAPPPEATIGTPQSAPNSAFPSTTMIGDLIHESQVFGNIVCRVSSQNFKGGSISTIFGDAHIDLTGAIFSEGDHELKVHSVFGNTFITLQKDAAIAISASSVFGNLTILGQRKSGFSTDVQMSSASYSTQTRRLRISLSKVFGDARIE